MSQTPGIGQNPDGGISDFRISGQSFINKNYVNSRTSHDTDMKLGPVTKFDNGKAPTSKKFDYVMSTNFEVSVFFSDLWSAISRIKAFLVLKGIFPEYTYVY